MGDPGLEAEADTQPLPAAELAMREAIESAIKASEKEVHRLRVLLGKAQRALDSAAKKSKQELSDLTPEQAAPLRPSEEAISDMLAGAGASLEDFFARYTGSLSTFNIALFGRTGAGKSTLLSALAELDGERVSHGESDWTVDVTPVPWNSCRLYDTPGINGWGRTASVERLEAAARRAVEVADVVLLCFDSQSQQASEFEKVAAWVEEYSKPAIAVLNVRNPMWRHPARIRAEAARTNLQRSVREHASNIRDALTTIGMGGVPVVAVHTKHALDARAAQPYVGPDDVNHHRRRAEFGVDYLYRWSNIGTVQELISALVTAGGDHLRLEGVRSGVRTVLETWSGILDTEASAIRRRLEILDETIAEELEVLGYPDESNNWLLGSANDSDARPVEDPLSRVEEARGGAYQSKRRGRFERHLTQVVRNELRPLRTASLKQAANSVRDSFDNQRTLSSEEFTARVVDQTAIDAAAARAADRAAAFLARELGMTATESAADLTFENTFAAVHGEAGQLGNRIGTAAQGGGLLAGALGAGLSVALLTQAWNPVGWVGGALLGATALVSMVLNWFGRRKRESAERRKLKERKDALGSVRVAVNSLYTKLEADLTGSFLDEARGTRAPVTGSMLVQWLAVDGVRCAMCDAAAQMRAAAEELSASFPLDQVVEQALEAMTDQREGAPDAASVLLGENWLGFDPQYERTETADTSELAKMAAGDAERLQAAITSIAGEVDPDQLVLWLDAVGEIAKADPAVNALLAEGRRRLGSAPRIVLLGDYNTGKSSLLKRMLAEAGTATPSTLKVAARPTTSTSTAYEWAGLQLIDSPGVQADHADHQEAAKAVSSGAAIVVVVLNVNLVIGDQSQLRALLAGTDRTYPKARQALFVIGRSDELGVDPLGNPAQFLRLRGRKEAELRQLLARWEVDGAAIHTVSADPYGIVGDDPVSGPDDFSSEFRPWDGIGALTSALELADRQADALVRVGVRDLTADGLLAIAANLRDELTVLAEECATESATLGTIRRGIDSGLVLASSLSAEGQAMARSHAERAAAEAMGATEERLLEATDAAAHWWGDSEFQADAVAFYDQSEKEIATWSADTDSELSRNLRWAEHGGSRRRRTGGRRTAAVKTGVGVSRGANDVGRVVTNILKERNTLYTAAKKFTNIRFKPWGATKAAARVAKVGAVLAVVGVVLDAASFVADLHAAGEREKARARLADSIEKTLARVETSLLRGTKRSPGPVAVLDTAINHLRDQEAAANQRVALLRGEMLNRERLLGRIEDLVSRHPMANGKESL